MSRRRYKKKKQETADLQSAFLRFTQSVSDAQARAEAIAPHVGRTVSQMIDLREAGRILDRYPQLSSYLLGIRERQEAMRDAETRPLLKSSPTGAGSQGQSLGGWSAYNDTTQPQGVNNARVLRDFVDQSEWVASAVGYYCERISRADIAVLPEDERLPYSRSVAKTITSILDNPNELGDTFPDLISSTVRDYLTIGRGTITKNMSASRVPQALYMEDASLIKIYPQWNGNPDEPRYLYQQNAQTKIPLRNDEVVCMLCGLASFRFSFSPVQTLRNTILADIRATESASRLVEQKPPPHVIQLPGTSEAQIKTLRTTYDADIAGRREVMFLGGPNPAQIKSMIYSLRDNQWMEWLEYLARKIMAVFGLSPQDLGLTFDINKATAGSQQEISEEKGLIPLMLRIESYLNRHFLADFAPRRGGRADLGALNLRIVFPEISEASRILHAEKAIDMATRSLAGLPSQTLNQVLMAQGLEPLRGGNTFYIKTATGAVPWLSYDDNLGTYVTPPAAGTQDAEGGVAADEQSDDDVGNSDTSANNQSGENENGGGASTSQGGSNENGGGASDTSEKGYWQIARDYRRAGVRWNPASTRIKRADALPARTPPIAIVERTLYGEEKMGELV